MKLSGFTFIHNAITGGYPIAQAVQVVQPYVDEIVVVDMESTDGTAQAIAPLGVRLLSSPWGGERDNALKAAFRKHNECQGDVIIFFEADEVYDPRLVHRVKQLVYSGIPDLGIYRLQLSENFQRCRWYPTPVHRVFPRGGGSYLEHPTNCPAGVTVIGPEYGYLWDISNCFRDNWLSRKHNQSELWGPPRSLMVPEHFTQPVEISWQEENERLCDPLWEWTVTPFAIPEILKPLVGLTKYRIG